MTIRIGLLPVLIPFIALPLAACDKADGERVIAAIKGDPIPQEPYTLAAVPSSSEEPAVVEAVAPSSSVEPPVPPPCDPVQWRGNWYSCDMMVLLGPVE